MSAGTSQHSPEGVGEGRGVGSGVGDGDGPGVGAAPFLTHTEGLPAQV